MNSKGFVQSHLISIGVVLALAVLFCIALPEKVNAAVEIHKIVNKVFNNFQDKTVRENDNWLELIPLPEGLKAVRFYYRFTFDINEPRQEPWLLTIENDLGEVYEIIRSDDVGTGDVVWTVALTEQELYLRFTGNGRMLKFRIDRVAVEGPHAAAQSTGSEDKLPDFVWNMWADLAKGHIYEPQPTLSPGRLYWFRLDLAPFRYAGQGVGVWSREGSQEFRWKVADWLDEDPAREDLNISAFVLPDTRYFEAPEEPVRPLKIKLNYIREAWKNRIKRPDTYIFDILKDEADQPFRFAKLSFKLRVKERLQGSSNSVWAPINVILFHKGRFVGEITATFCVGDDCEQGDIAPVSTSPTETFMAISEQDIEPPDAALYILEEKPTPGRTDQALSGIFLVNDPSWPGCDGHPCVWQVEKHQSSFAAKLESTFLDAIGIAKTQVALLGIGKDMLSAIMPLSNSEATRDSEAARMALASFVKTSIDARAATPTAAPPMISIRVVLNGGQKTFFIPLGLLVVEIEGRGPVFLGRHFRIEAPLPLQSYAGSDSCISNWVVALPPQDTQDPALAALDAAIDYMGDSFNKWKGISAEKFGNDHDMGQLRDWFEQDVNDTNPTALLITSHHDKNYIYYSSTGISYSTLRRNFPSPSLGVLNVCEGAVPSAAGFIEKFNDAGMKTIIATSAKVGGPLAGEFMRCFYKFAAKDRQSDDYDLSRLHFDTIQCVWDSKRKAFGAKALKYALFGNGNIRVCLPEN